VILRRFSSLVLAVLLVGAAGIGLLVAAPGFVGLHSITVAGGSMNPTIPLGSVAVTRTIEVDQVAVGDIVVFVPPGGHVPVMHRVIDMKRDGKVLTVHTKGDANNFVDPHVTKMKGSGEEVVAHIPFVGYVLNWIHRVPIILFAIPLLMMAFAQPLIDLVRARGRRTTVET
jgi:signal peptidase